MIPHQYPREILPSLGWKKGIKASDIANQCKDALVGHLLEGEEKDLMDFSLGEDLPQIRLEALPYKRVPNLSCSLLGVFFLPKHFHFLPKNEGEKTWEEDVEISEGLLVDDNYRYIEKIIVVGWSLTDIHQWPIKYSRSFAKKSDYDAFKKKSEEISKVRNIDMFCQEEWIRLKRDPNNSNLCIADAIGEAYINHDPTKLNYWHFTIDMYPADSEDRVKGIGKKWSNSMAIRLGDYLRQTFVIVGDTFPIPQITDKKLWIKESV